MEGSGQGGGAAATGADAGGDAAQQEGTAAAAAVDLAPLTGMLEGVQTDMTDLREIVTGLAGQVGGQGQGDGADAGDDADDGIDLSFLDADDANYDPNVIGERLTALVDKRAQQLVKPLADKVNGLDSRFTDGERTSQMQELVAAIPDFGDPKIADQVIRTTHQMAEAFGWPKEQAEDPRMWRMVYMAAKAAEIANAEGDGTDADVATLEGGGGARPAGGQPRDLGAEIVASRRGSGALPFP